jgi:hypothetical protein
MRSSFCEILSPSIRRINDPHGVPPVGSWVAQSLFSLVKDQFRASFSFDQLFSVFVSHGTVITLPL